MEGRREGECEAPKSGSFICGTSEAHTGIVAFSKRHFAGYYKLFLFIRGDTGMRACECVSAWEKESELKKRSLRRETNTNSHKMGRDGREREKSVCVRICGYARRRKKQNAEVGFRKNAETLPSQNDPRNGKMGLREILRGGSV